MANPLKVLFLLEDLCFGGTQKQNLELARRLDRKFFSPAILTLTGETDLDSTAREAEIPLEHLGRSRKAAPFFFMRLGRALGRLRPDILVPCTALPNIWGRLWGSLLKIPVIVGTCRGGGAPLRQHEWLLWRLGDAIVCNSPALCQKMSSLGVPASRLVYIPNGVDTALFQPVRKSSAEKLIVCVARLADDKDHPTLIAAFARVAAKFPTVRLRLVGEGPREQALRRLVADSVPTDIARRIEFAGAAANTASHYADADIFALSSVREGQPNVILEAMSSGLPVCATNVGGIPGLVENNATGFLSEAADSDALAFNLERLLEDPGLCEKFGSAGRSVAERGFSFSAMVSSHQELFTKLWLAQCGNNGRNGQ